jgi:hypothetical protein
MRSTSVLRAAVAGVALLPLAMAVAGGDAYSALPRAAYGAPRQVAAIRHAAIAEISGLAASQRRDDLLWAVNDSDNGAWLHALGTDGTLRGSVRVDGARNDDWEDLASFTLDGRPWLLIADSGDNAGARREIVLYVVAEPELPLPSTHAIGVAWSVRVRFADAPRDVEAVAVDVAHREVLLLAKKRVPAPLFRIALDPPASAGEVRVAEQIAVVPTLPQPTAEQLARDPQRWRYQGQITGAALAPDGATLALLTYRDGYVWTREGGRTWREVTARDPQRLGLPRLVQAEGITFDRHGRSLWVTTEKLPAPLLRLDRR